MHGATEQDPVWNLYCRNIDNFTEIIYMMFITTFFNKSMKERKKERKERKKKKEKMNLKQSLNKGQITRYL